MANSSRDADLDFDALKGLLFRPAVRTLQICTRYFREGWTAAQIAREMGFSEGAIRQTIRRVRQKLKEYENVPF